MVSRGLEVTKDYDNRWNGEAGSGLFGSPLMQVAMPQLYAELALGKMNVKLGHYVSDIGYEKPIANMREFYLTNYTTSFVDWNQQLVTGLEAKYPLTDSVELLFGFTRGAFNWEDNNNELTWYGGGEWIPSQRFVLNYQLVVGADDDLGQNTRYMNLLILECQLAKRWSYVLHSDYIHAEGPGEFFSILHYLFYEVCDNVRVGVRYEWFDDKDAQYASPNISQKPTLTTNSYPGVLQELTFGATIKQAEGNVIWRPEVRWDWYGASSATQTPAGPFDQETRAGQFVAALELRINF
jgi:hypothetical protein